MEVLTLEDTKTEIGYETCPYGDFDLGGCEQGSLSGVGEIRTGRRAASSSTRASSAWSSIGLSNDSIIASFWRICSNKYSRLLLSGGSDTMGESNTSTSSAIVQRKEKGRRGEGREKEQ